VQIIDIFFEQSALILTGVFITFISSIIYRITPTGFVSAGKYRTKEGAIAIFLLSAAVLGIFTPLIYQLCNFIIINVPILSILGLLIFLANFIINQSVPSWRHTTPKTLLIYTLSVVMIILGFVIKL
jgi:fatty acid desaturase